MPIELSVNQPTLLIRRAAFEQYGFTRALFDEWLGLTPDEFRLEGDLIAIGPLPAGIDVADVIEELEGKGLSYFDDFFDLSGNWPAWLRLYAMVDRPPASAPDAAR